MTNYYSVYFHIYCNWCSLCGMFFLINLVEKNVIWGCSNPLCSNYRDLHACSVAQSCLTPCDPMDWNPPDCSVSGISQAGMLEWVAMSSSRASCRPRARICLFYVGLEDSLPLSCQGSWYMWVYVCKRLTSILKGYQHPCNRWGLILWIGANQYP